MFNKIENKKISQIVIEQIQDMIMTDKLKKGDKLPPERELTKELNIGRPALREALQALEVVGLLESRHGQGNYIVNNTQNILLKPLSLSFKLSNGKAKDILELRHIIEAFTIANAAKHATDKDIKNLYEIHNNFTKCDIKEKSKYDKMFHYEIANIGDNQLIINMLESTSYLFDLFVRESLNITSLNNDSMENVYKEHLSIIKAIEAHDENLALNCIKEHLDNINTSLFKIK